MGHTIQFSSRKRKSLQMAVVEQFAPRFAPGSRLLYAAGRGKQPFHADVEALQRFGLTTDKHVKLPAIVLYSPRKHWLYLIEAAPSRGPISIQRREELERLRTKRQIRCIYVSAFRDFRQFEARMEDVAWNTQVWIAQTPDHIIHFNGDKPLRPRRASRH